MAKDIKMTDGEGNTINISTGKNFWGDDKAVLRDGSNHKIETLTESGTITGKTKVTNESGGTVLKHNGSIPLEQIAINEGFERLRQERARQSTYSSPDFSSSDYSGGTSSGSSRGSLAAWAVGILVAAGLCYGIFRVFDPGKPSPNQAFFEANRWEDTRGDNTANYPDGYKGIKDDFKDNERIIFVGHDFRWRDGDKIEFVLYGPNNGVVLKGKNTIPYDKGWFTEGNTSENLMLRMMYSSNGGYGDYKIVWYDNGQPDGQSEFTISKTAKEKILDSLDVFLNMFRFVKR